jgi:adenylate cyclase
MHAFTDLACCKLYAGWIDEVMPLVQRAIRLSPRDPLTGGCYVLVGTVHLLKSRTEEAIAWLEKARTAIPAATVVHSRLASAYALRGEIERADAELTEARKLNGGDVFSSIARLRTSHGGWWGAPKTRVLYEATYFTGLRKAGMPEE